MNAERPSQGSQAFGDNADARLIVAYQSHQDAMRFLSATLGRPSGVALLQGPSGSGKTTIVHEQADWSRRDAPVAVLDGYRLTPRQLVSRMLEQFGADTVPRHDEQLLGAANEFLTEQHIGDNAPVLFVDNIDRASESTQHMLNWLCALETPGRYSLRIVLTGEENLLALVSQDKLRGLCRRNPAIHSLNPLTEEETVIYLRTRLIAAGFERGDKVFPFDLCGRLHEKSQGWPGRINDLALQSMNRKAELKAARRVPRIVVTRDGDTVAEHELSGSQYVIGRSDLADIVIDDRFASKIHAMIQVYANALVMVDLNSTNGTTVNSIEKRKTILRNNDIISLGHHRLKIQNAPVLSAGVEKQIHAADTQILKNIDDIRKSRAKHTIAVFKHK